MWQLNKCILCHMQLWHFINYQRVIAQSTWQFIRTLEMIVLVISRTTELKDNRISTSWLNKSDYLVLESVLHLMIFSYDAIIFIHFHNMFISIIFIYSKVFNRCIIFHMFRIHSIFSYRTFCTFFLWHKCSRVFE